MISIVIPTLQKRADLLENLVKILNSDPKVGEIIIIDNSTKGINFSYNKLKVIVPKENCFVNPSWNLGIKEAQFIYIGLLNDDIIIRENLCSDILCEMEKIDNIGIVGFSENMVEPIEDINAVVEKKDIKLKKMNFIDSSFGAAMFFKKDIYPEIPEDLKIWYGDCYIFEKLKKQKYQNYTVTNQKIKHYGNLTSSSKNIQPLFKKDKEVWKKIKYKWHDYLFCFEEYSDCFKLRFLGLNIRLFSK